MSFKIRRRALTRRIATALTSLGVVIERTGKSETFDALIERRYRVTKRENRPFFFLQIGANDGINHDPIHAFVTSHDVAGIVIEPLPDVFEKLCHTYRRYPHIEKLNIAIHNNADRITLYRPDPLLSKSTGVASVHRHHLEHSEKRTGVGLDGVIPVDVPAKSAAAVLRDAQIEHVDLLQIDTEGYDIEIIKGFDLEQWQPSVIRFEHGIYSGTSTRDELLGALIRLYEHGYSVAMERVDALAWMQDDIKRRR